MQKKLWRRYIAGTTQVMESKCCFATLLKEMGVVKQKMKMRRERPNIHIRRDAVFDNDEDVALDGGDSDSDGYLAEVFSLTLASVQSESDTVKRKVLSGTVLSSCCNLVDEEQSVQALISLLNWYRAACHYGHEPSGITSSPGICYDIEDSETFANVIVFIVGLSGSANKEKILKLKNNPKWDSVKPLIKSFFRSTMHLVKQAADLEITVFALTQLRVSIVFFAAFPELLNKLIKLSVDLWVTGEETLSQQSFLILKDISKVFNSECFDACFISMYKAFLHDCDIPKADSEKRLPLLRDSLVELCSQNMQKSYTKASVSITQLAKLLKMALATKNKEAVEKIHSGHYTSCLDLWVSFIASNVQDSDLQSLLYTVVQVINGVATVFTGPRCCSLWLNVFIGSIISLSIIGNGYVGK
ncbi:hypothetical protein Bca52824_008414 [Brassica carinata]|uniref:Uncharacterized protein n=1 Tax=Brassica carinata TaxID=52824 RepID=A0A8X7W916_BRACI|nr:hypothetical protein Bca52824_008414 [Brassica carinata]